MKTPSLPLHELARQLRVDVYGTAATVPHTQQPAYYDGLIGKFCLAGCESAAAAVTPKPAPSMPAVSVTVPEPTAPPKLIQRLPSSTTHSRVPTQLPPVGACGDAERKLREGGTITDAEMDCLSVSAAPPVSGSQPTTVPSELARRLQQSLKNYDCYRGNVDGVWSQSSEQALALFARENGQELEDLKPTVENILKVEGGVSAGCPSLRQDDKNGRADAIGCSPRSGVHHDILSEPDPAKPYPDAPGIGTSWSLVDVQVIANSKGRYLYGRLFSPRGGYQKWVYGRAEQWDCEWPTAERTAR
jgi:hypothetical protein